MYYGLSYDADFKLPHDKGFLVLVHQLVEAQTRNVLAQKAPDKQADPGDAGYNFSVLVETLVPKKGLIASSTNLPAAAGYA